MEKMNHVKFDNHRFIMNTFYKTKYDDLFDYKIINRGELYFSTNSVKNVSLSGDTVTGVVSGTYDYNVSIKFLNDKNIDVSCECEYYKGTNKYCKHVYALLLAYEAIEPLNKFKKEYKNNYNKIIEIKNNFRKLSVENKHCLDSSDKKWCKEKLSQFDEFLRWLDECYVEDSIHKILSATYRSYDYLNMSIDRYNDLVEGLEKRIKKYEENQKEIEQEKLIEELNSKRSPEVRDMIEDVRYYDEGDIDYLVSEYDSSSIFTMINELEKEGRDVSLFKEAYRRRLSLETKQRDSDFGVSFFEAAFLYMLFGKVFKGHHKKPKKYDPFKDYESYNYEEEELEDDDYFNEDLD